MEQLELQQDKEKEMQKTFVQESEHKPFPFFFQHFAICRVLFRYKSDPDSSAEMNVMQSETVAASEVIILTTSVA